jgi:HK97 family phage major capsid protein
MADNASPVSLWQRSAENRQMAKSIVDAACAEDRELTEEETGLLANYRSEAERLGKMADRAQEVQDSLAETMAGASKYSQRSSQPLEVGTIQQTRGGGEADKQYSFSDFIRCVTVVGDRQASRDAFERAQNRLRNLYSASYRSWENDSTERRDMLQSSGTTGGYLVPTRLYTQLMEVAAEQSIVRPNAMVLPMGADTVEIPLLDQTTAQSAGDTPFYGGLKATWSAEAASITEQTPSMRQARLTAHELTGYTEVSRTLLSNSAITIDALLNRLFGGAVAWYEDYAFLRGDGIGKPLGILNSPAWLATGTARGSATAITLANAAAVYAKALPTSRNSGVWLVSQGAFATFLQMAGLSNGVILPAGFVSTTGAANAPAMTLMGRPVYISEKLPALNTAGDFGYYDLQQYVVGDRGTLEIAASEHFKFQNNMMSYRFVHRVGGMPWMNSYITLADASTTVSPFVYLTVQ